MSNFANIFMVIIEDNCNNIQKSFSFFNEKEASRYVAGMPQFGNAAASIVSIPCQGLDDDGYRVYKREYHEHDLIVHETAVFSTCEEVEEYVNSVS